MEENFKLSIIGNTQTFEITSFQGILSSNYIILGIYSVMVDRYIFELVYLAWPRVYHEEANWTAPQKYDIF